MNLLGQEKLQDSYDAAKELVTCVQDGYTLSKDEVILLIENFQGCLIHLSQKLEEIRLLEERAELLKEMLDLQKELMEEYQGQLSM